MPAKKKHIEGERLWSVAAENADPERPIALLARQVGGEQRMIRIRITPRELRWLVEHSPKVLMEFDICHSCSHPRANHAGVQGELVRGICAKCDRYCTKFTTTPG